MTTDPFDSKGYQRSRKAYMAQSTFEYLVMLLVGDVFLARLLTAIGMSDALTGIMSSFITLAFLFQLLSVLLIRNMSHQKTFIIFFSCFSQFLFICLYLVPFLPLQRESKGILASACIMLAYACSYLVSSHLYKWGNSYVNPYFRGEYSANKEILSLLSGVVFSLIAGKALDWFEASGNLYGGFVFITLCMLVSSICNFIALCLMKKNVKMTNEPKMKLRRIINHTLNNKQFQYIVILDIMRNIAAYLTLGFLGTFKTKDLMFSIGTVQMINIFAYICRCLVSKPFGRYADRHSYVKVLELGYIIAATAYAVNMFTSQNTRWLIVLFTVLYFISDAAINANSLNVLYSYVKSDYFAYAAAIKNSISGIFGFSASLLSSRLLQYVQSNGNSFFSLNIYGQQLLSAMSCIMFLLAFLFAKLFIEKQEIVGH